MPTYVQLVDFTQDGLQDVKRATDRLDAAKELMHSLDAEMKDFYLTMGQHDAVVIFDAPSDEVVARGTLTHAQDGSITTETMRAFDEVEFRDIVDAVESR